MKKIFLLLVVSFFFGAVVVPMWLEEPAHAKRGGVKQCDADLNMCNTNLGICEGELASAQVNLTTCDTNLSTCEANLDACEEDCQIFPGDGYTDPSFGTYGHEPALSYTDNGDGTFTDNNTGYMWEKKLPTDGSEGGNCQDPDQANRSVHCENNEYTWSATGSASDGTLFTDFLAGVNGNALGGFSDWCIPDVRKLLSIVDYSRSSPASSIPGSIIDAWGGYWSSTTQTNPFTNRAWIVSFAWGSIDFPLKEGALLARAVRPCP